MKKLLLFICLLSAIRCADDQVANVSDETLVIVRVQHKESASAHDSHFVEMTVDCYGSNPPLDIQMNILESNKLTMQKIDSYGFLAFFQNVSGIFPQSQSEAFSISKDIDTMKFWVAFDKDTAFGSLQFPSPVEQLSTELNDSILSIKWQSDIELFEIAVSQTLDAKTYLCDKNNFSIALDTVRSYFIGASVQPISGVFPGYGLSPNLFWSDKSYKGFAYALGTPRSSAVNPVY